MLPSWPGSKRKRESDIEDQLSERERQWEWRFPLALHYPLAVMTDHFTTSQTTT